MEITNTSWRFSPIYEMVKPERFLLEAIERVSKYNYYIGFGTLLGFYRDKDFIPEDTDIDIEIIVDDESQVDKLIKSFSDYHYIRSVKDDKQQQSAFQKELMIIDLAFFRKSGDNYITKHEGGNFIDKTSTIGKKKVFKSKYCDFLIPEYPEEYLTAHYGDWRTKRNDKSVKICE